MGFRPVGKFLSLLLLIGGISAGAQTAPLEGVTFAEGDDALYLPLRELGESLGWPVRWDATANTAYLNERPLSPESATRLPDGTLLIPVRDLQDWGAAVRWDAEREVAVVAHDGRELEVRAGPERVVINRTLQQLSAWQGERLVLQTRVSTGRRGHSTPTGEFTAGPYKARMHHSSLYDDAPMPWSVQVIGNVFIHGFTSVPDYPASHGCIRMPMTGANPARWFYQWIDRGTPVVIEDASS
ncbi:MAG: L,D-transpeptidase family protein [Actinomycetota bacterium]